MAAGSLHILEGGPRIAQDKRSAVLGLAGGAGLINPYKLVARGADISDCDQALFLPALERFNQNMRKYIIKL